MITALDMFSVGIGPSSSHTVGPMRAGLQFAQMLNTIACLDKVHSLDIHIYGSLALTGEGHGTFLAVLHGIEGKAPETIDCNIIHTRINEIKQTKQLCILQQQSISFDYDKNLSIHKDIFLPQHPNALRFIAYDKNKNILLQKEYFSIGGGFIADEDEIHQQFLDKKDTTNTNNNQALPYPFSSAKELFDLCKKNNLTIAQLAFQNELSKKNEATIKQHAMNIIHTMFACIEKGITTEGILPGKLQVKRRAPELYKRFRETYRYVAQYQQPFLAMIYAIATNEENACFARVVTSPTNGSAGTIPAVLLYYKQCFLNITDAHLIDFLLTAGTIGVLYKKGASISAAEVGCQGEIGVASSMAAAAFTAAMGGSLIQVEKAAEIAMEHSLGMTCDPIEGLVQIPCIERNGVAATRAIDIAHLALMESEPGKISLDEIIKTMMETGRDMSSRYKETSLGGLALNKINC